MLPPVLDVRDAMDADAAILHEEFRTEEMGEKGNIPTNVASHLQHLRAMLSEVSEGSSHRRA